MGAAAPAREALSRLVPGNFVDGFGDHVSQDLHEGLATAVADGFFDFAGVGTSRLRDRSADITACVGTGVDDVL
jgi:hypothetical protein